MKQKVEFIDGIEISTWKEIEKISKNYPKEIRFAQGAVSKIAMLKFYIEPLLPNIDPPMNAMDQGRMLTIAYKMYKESDDDVIKELSLKIIKKIIN